MRKNMRTAFNLLMAIGIILILSGAAIMTMKYVSISAKHISDSYIKEQAEIFAQSVMEATILKIEGHDRNASSTNNSAETFDGNCTKSLVFNSSDGKFHADVNITKYYLYNGVDNDGVYHCSTQTKNELDVNISTSESHGYVMIETVVTTNPNNAKVKDSKIRIVKRSLQRP